MARIKHVQLKVLDRFKTADFYEKVFGFKRTGERQIRGDHKNVHVSDGDTDLAIVEYTDEASEEARMHGAGPKIGHFGIEVEDAETCVRELEKRGCTFLTPRGTFPAKFKMPGVGGIIEVAPTGFFKHPRDPKFKNVEIL